MAFGFFRIALYTALVIFSIILLGLTAARIDYTEHISTPDILHAGSKHYYDPIVVELLVTSILALLWSLWLIFAIFGRVERGYATSYLSELIGVFILWVMFLVGAAIATNKWDNLSFCRGSFKECRILTSIVALSWIVWSIMTFLLLAVVIAMSSGRRGPRTHLHGKYATQAPATAGTTNAYADPAAGTNAGMGVTTGPETRNVNGVAPPVSTAKPVSSNV